MTVSNRGHGVLRITDFTTKEVLFAAQLVVRKVTNEEDTLTLAVESINDIVASPAVIGSVTPIASQEPQQPS